MAISNPKLNLSSVSEIRFVSARVEVPFKKGFLPNWTEESPLFSKDWKKSVLSTSYLMI